MQYLEVQEIHMNGIIVFFDEIEIYVHEGKLFQFIRYENLMMGQLEDGQKMIEDKDGIWELVRGGNNE